MFHPRPANLDIPPPPKSPTQPATRRSAVPVAPTDVAAIKRRRAALQQCGLVAPPPRDLSQLEAELDRTISHVVILSQEQKDQEELSSAERIRREWQAKNETQIEKQGHDAGPTDVTPASLNPGRLDSVANTEEQDSSEFIAPQTLLSPTSPVPLSPIPEAFSFTDIPEEHTVVTDVEKGLHPSEGVDPLTAPLPNSPLSSSFNLLDLSPTPTSRESKRPPPIVVNLTANGVKQHNDEATRGRSQNRDSTQSLASRRSLPALSPTVTASSSSSLPTPRDEESRERMESVINRSNSIKSRSSRFGKVTDIRRDSEELGIVPEASELPANESRAWNPNRESNATLGSTGFEAFVEKRERRRISTGIFQPSKRSSGSFRSSRKSTASSVWSAFANDFALKPFEGAKARSSTLPATSTLASKDKELISTHSQPVIEQPRPKITRSKSVIASLGLKISRKTVQASLPPSPSTPTRQPTVRIVENRENLMKEMVGIEDDESRRLTELAFMDF
ncbi:hypothetical protein BJ322DRAFT_391743 [Thelephora terrestris]|uniref:Uncharacterized protein n=1 Tax=Thelephora terrestris TaxID=56493 RepID=A0A9P6HQ21_9AGAM|nr:hypothetical protein BJ322DRAFT_391743 [Thelephora terrestris]